MQGNVARRSLEAVAGGRRNVKVLADWTEASRQITAQMLEDSVKDSQLEYRYDCRKMKEERSSRPPPRCAIWTRR